QGQPPHSRSTSVEATISGSGALWVNSYAVTISNKINELPQCRDRRGMITTLNRNRSNGVEESPHNLALQALLGPIICFGEETYLTGQQGLDNRSEEHTSELQSRFDLVCR